MKLEERNFQKFINFINKTMNQLRKEKYDIGFSTCGTSIFLLKIVV